MLQFSFSKKLLIWAVCAIGIMMAAPNAFYTQVEQSNDAEAILETGVPATPELTAQAEQWPSFLPSSLVNLGLDLRGGAHLLAEVHVEDVLVERLDGYWPQIRNRLRTERAMTGGIVSDRNAPSDQLRIRLKAPSDPEAITRAVAMVRELASPIVSLTGVGSNDIDVSSEGDVIVVRLSEAEIIATNQRTMDQSLEIIRRRVDEAGTREPTIQRQGDRRILIQVPGIGSAEELKELIGKTAKLTFHPVLGRTGDDQALLQPRQILLPDVNQEGLFYILEKTPTITGDHLVDAQAAFDQNNQAAVNFRLNPTGGRIFGEYTANNIGSAFAIVLDDEVLSAPTIQSHIPGGSGIITGQFNIEETTSLAIQLRAGALPAKVTYLEERTIGPELGQDSIDAGTLACIVAFIAVLVFMILSYGLFGLFANIALIINVGMIFGLLSLIGATLTLPGIAGIVLTIGMAVDANVLVFERIREEIRAKKAAVRSIELGYERAFSAIIDANITTLIAAVILFVMGSGPVRGFAITLGLGIITSVFTAIWVTRLLISIYMQRRRPKTIEV
ncbi:protein translocase subunit SecD [Amylibacter sp. SFDW26]|uniref:protein translocase subunit SecD n=1 Tax=Amylibacter sp. SFDW26 TaxID=2652722 RepID=UPI001262548F|nr:protein translocase subunit SecD [Amylibacter sp. SFDW26]KAB7616256.1 protein translocase subunit SecD [Amylibacter sp. SFDW26]